MQSLNRSVVVVWALLCGSLWAVDMPASVQRSESPFADKAAHSRSGKEFKWRDVKPNDLGATKIDYKSVPGMRQIKPAPAPGVHPRIFFGPDEVESVHQNIQDTKAGQELWLNALAWIHAMKGTYDRSADYAKPARSWKGYRVPLERLWIGKDLQAQGVMWNQLRGEEAPKPEDISRKVLGRHWPVFALEAFRCLMENDEAAGRELCTVVERALRLGQKARADDWAALKEQGKKPARPNMEGPLDGKPYGPLSGSNLAYCYDFLYNWMTPAQRDLVRAELANATDLFAHMGTFLQAEATTSNWVTLDGFHVIPHLAIYGEEGFNDLKYRGTLRAWKNFLTYGWYPSGEGLEGRGKNYQYNDVHVAFARLGDNLLQHPHVLPYGEKLLVHASQPYGCSFFAHDLLGGTDRPGAFLAPREPGKPHPGRYGITFNDHAVLKWAFPTSKRIDWVYRQCVGDDYGSLPQKIDGRYNRVLTGLIFASDYDPDNHPSKFMGEELSFFCPRRGLMITRSDWGGDALMLSIHTRQDQGGHTYSDRNSFILTGKGRIWAQMYPRNAYGGFQHSVITIDGKASACMPARVVDYSDNQHATFMTGDAVYSWRWQSGWSSMPVRYRPMLETANDFYYKDLDNPYYDLPFYKQADWLTPGKTKGARKSMYFPEMRRAFRTAGIVRGTHPFALVVDDIQIDEKKHDYTWAMQVPWDVAIHKNLSDGVVLIGGAESQDQTKETQAPEGTPLLLVKIIDNSGKAKVEMAHDYFFLPEKVDVEKSKGNHESCKKTLLIKTTAIAPDFKVLLYPYRQGEAVPAIAYTKDTGRLSVEFADYTRIVDVTAKPAGMSAINVYDGEQKLLTKLDNPLPPMPDRDAQENERVKAVWEKVVSAAKQELGDFTPEQVPGLAKFKLTDLSLGTAGSFRDGVNGKGIKLNGGSEGIKLPAGLPPQAGRPFTVYFWTVSGSHGHSINTNPGHMFRNGGRHDLALYNYQTRLVTLDIGKSYRFVRHPNRLFEWHQIAVTFDGERTAAFFFDGELIKKGNTKSKLTPSQQSIIGGARFAGSISDLRLFDRALSPEEISRLFKYDAFLSHELSENRALLLKTLPGYEIDEH